MTGDDKPATQWCQLWCVAQEHGIIRTFEQLSHVKIVPRFFPFLVITPDGEPEMLNPSSKGTELLTPRLETGIVTGPVGA